MQRCLAVATQMTVVAVLAIPTQTHVFAEAPQLAPSGPVLSSAQLPSSGPPAAGSYITAREPEGMKP